MNAHDEQYEPGMNDEETPKATATIAPSPATASSWMKVSGPTNSGEPKAFTTTTFTNHTAATLKSWIKTRVAVSVGSARSRITGFALLVARLLFDTFSY